MIELPAELLAQILRCAQEGQSLAERVQTRLLFEKVCKAWYKSEFRWRILGLNKRNGVTAALRAFDGAACAKVKAVYVGLDEHRTGQADFNLLRFLTSLSNLESVEFGLRRPTADSHGDDLIAGTPPPAPSRSLMPTTQLAKLTRLTLSVENNSIPCLHFMHTLLRRLLTLAPNLHSITVAKCQEYSWISTPTIANDVSYLAAFSSFEVDGVRDPISRQFSHLCILPTTTRELRLNSTYFSTPPNAPSSFNRDEWMLALGENLTVLEFTDAAHLDYVEPSSSRPGSDRGMYDQFVANLNQVKTLAISPVAVTNLGALARLSRLTDLTLRVGRFLPRQRVEPSELVTLIRNSRSLKILTLGHNIAPDWTEEKQSMIDAAPPGVQVLWA